MTITPAVVRLSTVVVAAGLGWLAWVDGTTGRIPREVIRLVAVALVAAMLIALWGDSDPSPLLRAAATATICLLVLGALWWRRPELIGFGDVKLIALAGAAAAAISWLALARVMVASSLVAAGLMVCLSLVRQRRGSAPDGAIPLSPAVCVGFIAGAAS